MYYFECIGCGEITDFDPNDPVFEVLDRNCVYCGTDGCDNCLVVDQFDELICCACEQDFTDDRDPLDEEETERNDEGD